MMLNTQPWDMAASIELPQGLRVEGRDERVDEVKKRVNTEGGEATRPKGY